MKLLFIPALAICALAACAEQSPPSPAEVSDAGISRSEAEQIYDYAYPLVIMKISQDLMFTSPFRPRSGPNHFIHFKNLAQPQNRAVVLGNRNTLYSVGWVDLSQGPVVFEIPDMGERYYVMPLLDAWTNTFESLGSRTSGQGAEKYILVSQEWRGDAPAGFETIVSPTNMVWITGRIQADSAEDAIEAGKLQDSYRLMTYAEMQGSDDPFAAYEPTFIAATVRRPVPYSLSMSAAEYYNTFFSMWPANPSPNEDAIMLDIFARAGVAPDAPPAFEDLPQSVQSQLTAGLETKQAAYKKAFFDGANQTEPWIFNLDPGMGDWGTDFSRRAYWAMWGLGTNIAKDAVYGVTQLDKELAPLNGENVYRLHFDRDETPPTSAFWSVTNYDEDGYLEPNKENRYSLGSNHHLSFNADGSLDFYLSSARPNIDGVNWVPAPAGNFKTLLRVYWPEEKILEGEWRLPPLERVDLEEPD